MSFISPITEEQFEKMACEQLPFLRGMALRILRNAQDADDAVQNAMVRGWTRRFLLRTPERLGGWISRILVNECYTLLRKRKREKTVYVEKLPEIPMKEAVDVKPEIERLEEAIAELPEIYRQTVQIALLGRLDAATASRKLGCSVNTLYQRIHKAKGLLAEKMRNGGK